jgi:hypothetical protein
LIIEGANVARVHAYRSASGVDRREDVPGLEVDVGDHGDLGLLRDHREGVSVVLARYGNADDVAAGRSQLGDLLERGVDVCRQRGGHRLHADRRIAADRDLADVDLAALATRRKGRWRKGWQTQVDAHKAFHARQIRRHPE